MPGPCATVFLPPEGVSPCIDHHFERFVGLVHSRYSAGNPDLQILFQDNPAAGPNQAPPARGYAVRASLMLPYSRGVVRLADANPGTPPVIDPQYYSDSRDMRMMRDGLRIARALGQSQALAPWRTTEFFPGPDIQDDSELLDTHMAWCAKPRLCLVAMTSWNAVRDCSSTIGL